MDIILNPNDLAKVKITLLIEILAAQKAHSLTLFQKICTTDEDLTQMIAIYDQHRSDEVDLIRSQLIADYGDLSSLF